MEEQERGDIGDKKWTFLMQAMTFWIGVGPFIVFEGEASFI